MKSIGNTMESLQYPGKGTQVDGVHMALHLDPYLSEILWNQSNTLVKTDRDIQYIRTTPDVSGSVKIL